MNDADDVRFPSRRPWLLLAVVLIVGLVLALRYQGGVSPRAGAPEASSVPVAAPATPPSAPAAAKAPAAATNAAPAAAPAATGAPPAVAVGVASNLEERLAAGAALEGQGRLVDARTNDLALLKEPLGDDARRTVEERLGKVNVALVTTPLMMPEKEEYIVASGDSIDKIARKFGTTVALIQRSNERTNSLIKAGDRFRVFKGRFEVAVSKSRNELLLSMNGEFFKRYAAGTGRYGRTPVGTFVVSDKVIDPPWWREGKVIPFGDKENILGTRWLALRATGATLPVSGYGIHGSWDEAGIGKAESAGCVRLKNADVEELFELLPYGAAVTITE